MLVIDFKAVNHLNIVTPVWNRCDIYSHNMMMHLDSVLLGRHISVGGPLAQCKRHMVFARVNLNRLVSQRNLSANVNKHSLAQCVCFEAKAKQPD